MCFVLAQGEAKLQVYGKTAYEECLRVHSKRIRLMEQPSFFAASAISTETLGQRPCGFQGLNRRTGLRPATSLEL